MSFGMVSNMQMNTTPVPSNRRAMKPDAGMGTYSNTGSRLGMQQTGAGGGGGFNIGGMASWGGGGLMSSKTR